jgi:hypothetical protein
MFSIGATHSAWFTLHLFLLIINFLLVAAVIFNHYYCYCN